MEGAFGDEAVVPEEVAVVGGVDDERVFAEAEGIELVEDLTDGMVGVGHHPVVGRHVLRHGFFVVQVALAAVQGVALFFAPEGEVGLLLLSHPEVLRVFVVFAFLDGWQREFTRVIHRVPRFRNEVGRMWIWETRPGEEGLVGVGTFFEVGVGFFDDEIVVVELFG